MLMLVPVPAEHLFAQHYVGDLNLLAVALQILVAEPRLIAKDQASRRQERTCRRISCTRISLRQNINIVHYHVGMVLVLTPNMVLYLAVTICIIHIWWRRIANFIRVEDRI